MKRNYIKEKKEKYIKTTTSNLDRFRNDVVEFTKNAGDLRIPINKINSKSSQLSRKELRKLERKLKGAKKEAFLKKSQVSRYKCSLLTLKL
jgi:hypothetical protein